MIGTLTDAQIERLLRRGTVGRIAAPPENVQILKREIFARALEEGVAYRIRLHERTGRFERPAGGTPGGCALIHDQA